MGFEDIPLVRSYSSDSDDILNAFYVPVLENSHKYYRLAGFFSSTCLALAARGIVGLIRNNGVMKLIVSPRLSKKDVNAIIDSTENPIKYCENKMIEEFDKLENDFIRDHIFALGWMIANKKLKIKIALVYDKEGKLLRYDKIQEKGIFHQKVGILKDVEGKIISFSGSVNESAMGWMDNIEEFKVFRSWESGEEEYVASDYKRFKKFWRNESPRVEVIKSPVAIENKLIQIAPCHIKSIDIEKWYKKRSEKCVKLFKYQQEAINKWFENGKKGIFEMATGTGKTFTALGCVSKIKDADNKVVIVISSPYSHLSYQWKNELNKIGIEIHSIIADSTNRKWKTEITDYLTDIKLSYRQNLIIFTTHRTLSSNIFCKIIQQYKKSLGIPFFLIVDEVHGIGAEKSSIGLLEEYDYRLGLSATPKRWFDNEGTNIIYRYFNDVLFEFSLKNAIRKINPLTGKTYLTPYRYNPIFITLNQEELDDYVRISKSIMFTYKKASKESKKAEILERLMFKRANVIKNALFKYEALMNILNQFNNDIKLTIIYCSPQQIDTVMGIINNKNIIAHKFTMEEGTHPDLRFGGISEREYIINNFAKSEYQVLVAMKCLDEGVDVPPARNAIIMASSGNPREYIQRIGRVIRRYKDKEEASIYDIIVAPSMKNLPSAYREVESKIFEKELKRYKEIASSSINPSEAFNLINEIEEKKGDKL